MAAIRHRRPALLVAAAVLLGAAGPVPGSGPGSGASGEDRQGGAFGAYLAGRLAVQGRDFGAAARSFEQALRDDPAIPELNGQAFLAALLAGQPQAARLAATLSGNPLAQLVLADRDGKAGRWSAAQTRFAALPRDGGLMDVLRPLLVAWAQVGGKNVDGALATLQPLVDGTRFRALYALHAALIADGAGRTPVADRLYRIAASDFGTINLRVATVLASWQARNGRTAEAERTLADLAAADSEFAMSRAALTAEMARSAVSSPADGIAEAYLALGATLRAQSVESAQAMVRLALDMRPDLVPAQILLSDIEAAAKRPDNALAALTTIRPNDPLAPAVALRRAALLDESGQGEAGIALLQRLSREHPDRPEPWAQLGDILRRKNRWDEAAAAYKQAIGKLGVPSRANWPLFYARGIALERGGDWPAAEADLKYALELAPDQPSILNYLAYSWAERGENLAQARSMLERAMAARPNEGAFIDSLGWVLLRQGDTDGAIRELERAVELEPEDPTINGHLGDALQAAGRVREADFQWRRALNLKPEEAERARLQAKLTEVEQAPAATPAAAAGPTQ